jgi:hypothetical protein
MLAGALAYGLQTANLVTGTVLAPFFMTTFQLLLGVVPDDPYGAVCVRCWPDALPVKRAPPRDR